MSWSGAALLAIACGAGGQAGRVVRGDVPKDEPKSLAASPPSAQMSVNPLPVPTRTGPVVENFFGREVRDPYRWLEDGESEEVRHWTELQNAYTRALLDRVPGRNRLHARLGELLAIGTVSAPTVRRVSGEELRYFYSRRDGQQNQPVLYVRNGVAGRDEVLLDPNALSTDGVVALDWWMPSNDGTQLAYGLSQNGDEQSTLRVRDVVRKRDLPDRIERARFASIAWLPDNKSFYYTRHPQKGEVPEGEEDYHRAVFLHRLGDDPARDPLVFGKDRKMTDSPAVDISPSGRWLLVTVHQGWAQNELHLCDLAQTPHPFVPLAVDRHAIFDATAMNDVIYVRTNDGAPRYQLYAVDPKKPAREQWKLLIPESPDVLDSITVVGREIVATYLADASSRIRRYSQTGQLKGEVPLPTLGSTMAVSGLWSGHDVFFDYASFAVAPTVYRLDLRRGGAAAPEAWQAVRAPIDSSEFEIERVRATSKDGTQVPIFLVHRRGIARDGRTPTLLTGYGGFNVNIVPTFSRSSYAFLERGGVLAVANLRGGGEFGEEWHRAGMLGQKQNVFDDALAAARHLIALRITDAAHLAVQGGSNGGLLVGALITQAPELFRAAVSAVPLLDMLRYHRFRIAKLWISEYGSPEDPAQFPWLYEYSPYHHVRPGTHYPAVLFTTAESDSRVDPLHARKMTAALQAATSSNLPVLLRVDSKAGHGAGKPLAKSVEEQTDVWSFLFAELGVVP
jgi:prolyl oligopeptidase